MSQIVYKTCSFLSFQTHDIFVQNSWMSRWGFLRWHRRLFQRYDRKVPEDRSYIPRNCGNISHSCHKKPTNQRYDWPNVLEVWRLPVGFEGQGHTLVLKLAQISWCLCHNIRHFHIKKTTKHYVSIKDSVD